MSKAKGMYYTPKVIRNIIEPAAGSGNFLNITAELLSNPPYAPAPDSGSPTASITPPSAPDASDGRKTGEIGGVVA